MIQRGFALNVIPSAAEPGIVTLDVFIETWVDGALSTIEMRDRMVIEFDPEWLEQMPDEQYSFTMLETASQLMGNKYAPDGPDSFTKAIADAVRAIQKTLLDD